MKLAEYTKKIVSRLPYWFAIKKNCKNSLGPSFLNAIGMEMDEMLATLEYAYEQVSIDKADTDFIDICYKTILPDINLDTIVSVVGDGVQLVKIDALNDFFNSKNNIHTYDDFKDIDGYYIDAERKILYSRKSYNTLTITTNIPSTYVLKLTLHHIWNWFDEFGLILDTARLYGEKNLDYKNRIKDVFINPSGANRKGLYNGLARDLGCRTNIKLDNSSKDILLDENMIVLESVKSNNIFVPVERLFKNSEGKIVVKGDDKNIPTEISYIHSIELHQMHQYNTNDDLHLQSELFFSDGTATPKLKEYAKLINTLCPIMWNHARWDESYWINDLSEFGYIPHITDASIKGFSIT